MIWDLEFMHKLTEIFIYCIINITFKSVKICPTFCLLSLVNVSILKYFWMESGLIKVIVFIEIYFLLIFIFINECLNITQLQMLSFLQIYIIPNSVVQKIKKFRFFYKRSCSMLKDSRLFI